MLNYRVNNFYKGKIAIGFIFETGSRKVLFSSKPTESEHIFVIAVQIVKKNHEDDHIFRIIEGESASVKSSMICQI